MTVLLALAMGSCGDDGPSLDEIATRVARKENLADLRATAVAGRASLSATSTASAAAAAAAPASIPLATATATPQLFPGPSLVWERRFDAPDLQVGPGSLALDDMGNLYAVGGIGVALPGQTYSGGITDVFVRKYNSQGEELWTRQFGTSGHDSASVAVDGAGDVYLAGVVSGALPGHPLVGGDTDLFARKYDSEGNELWTRQLGTQGAGPAGLGEVYGQLRKLDREGNERWAREFGTQAADESRSVAVDGMGNPYVSGMTRGTFPGQTPSGGRFDSFLRKYDSEGNELWTRQFGPSFEQGLALDRAGNPYVVGRAQAALTGQTFLGGRSDAFVRKYDGEGRELWTRQLGTGAGDNLNALVVGHAGAAYGVGEVGAPLRGHRFKGGRTDSFMRKYDSEGTELWTLQFGVPGDDTAFAVVVDGKGNIYVVGRAGQGPAAEFYLRKYTE